MRSKVNLALLWGHIQRGIIRCSRSIVRRSEAPVPYALGRKTSEGRLSTTYIHSFGNFHLQTSTGPFPVSLVEIATISPSTIPEEYACFLHCLSIGYPVAGESIFRVYEKFYNPVVVTPVECTEPLIQNWLSAEGEVILSDNISTRLADFYRLPLDSRESKLNTLPETFIAAYPGESSACGYINHAQASHIRNDRGYQPPKGINSNTLR